MDTTEKIKLIADARSALKALGRIVDGGHSLEDAQLRRLHHDCIAAGVGLSIVAARLEAEVGTDNLNG